MNCLACAALLIILLNSFTFSMGIERDSQAIANDHTTLPTATTLREEILERDFKNSLVEIRRLVAGRPIQYCFLSYVNEDPDILWMRRIESYLREVGVQPTYDMRTLGVGDSIDAFITKGVETSNFAIILFSPRYFANFERGTYIRTEAEAIQQKWKDSEGFVIPLLLSEDPVSSIPQLMNRRPKDLSLTAAENSIGGQQPGGLDTLYISLTKGSDQADFEECLECVFRMLKERIFKGAIGANASSEHDFDVIKRTFDDRKLKIPNLSVRTELKAVRGSFPQSLKTYNAFLDRTNKIGQSYVDTIFEELFMGHTDERQFATLTICALSGMGGVGKTTLATEFAHKYKQFYEFIYWMDGSSKKKFLSSCVILLESFGVLVPEQRDVDKDAYFSTIIQMMNEFLPKRKKNWLLVVDNIEESEFVTEFLPVGGHVLYTSRNRDWLKRLEINVFKPDESVAYLLQMTGFEERYKDEAMALAIELDHLPLALAQSTAYITHQGLTSFTEYLVEYQARQAELLAKQQIQPSLNGKYGREAIVMTTWNTTMHKLSPDTQQLILYLSYCNSKAIPFETFKFLFDVDKLDLFCKEQSPTRLNPRQDIRDSLNELKRYSLINYNKEIASVHNLLQYVIQQSNQYPLVTILEKIIDSWFNFWEEDSLHKKRSKKELYKSYDNLNILMSHCEKLEIEHVKTLYERSNEDEENRRVLSSLEFKLRVLRKKINETLESIRLDIISSVQSKENFQHFVKKDLKIKDNELEELIKLQKNIFPGYVDPKSLLLILRGLSHLLKGHYKQECIQWIYTNITPHIYTIKIEEFVSLLDFVVKQYRLNSHQTLDQLKEELEQEHVDLEKIIEIIEDNRHIHNFIKTDIHKLKKQEWQDFVFAVKNYNNDQFNDQKISFIISTLKRKKPLENISLCQILPFIGHIHLNQFNQDSIIEFINSIDNHQYNKLIKKIEKLPITIKTQIKNQDDLNHILKINEEHWYDGIDKSAHIELGHLNLNNYIYFIEYIYEIETDLLELSIARVESLKDALTTSYDYFILLKALIEGKDWILSLKTPTCFNGLNLQDKNQFIKVAELSALSEDAWDTLVKCCDKLLAFSIDDVSSYCELLKILSSKTIEYAQEFIEKVNNLSPSEGDLIDTIKLISKVPTNTWTDLERKINSIGKKIKIPNCIRLSYKFREYNDKKWQEEILPTINSVEFLPDLSFLDYKRLIQVARETQDEQWSSIIINMQSLMQQGYDSSDCVRLIREFMFIESAIFRQSIEKINQLKTQLSVDEFLIGDYINLIKASSSVDPETWESLIQKTKPLVGRLELSNYLILIKTLLEFDDEKWMKSVEKIDFLTKELSKQSVTFPESSLSVAAVHPNVYSSSSTVDAEIEEPLRILNYVNTFRCITPSQRMKEVEEIETMDLNYFIEDYIDLIRCAAEMDDALWKSAVRKAKWMITKKMNAHDQIQFIRVAADMDDSVWESAIRKADILFTPTMGSANRIEIIKIAEELIQDLNDKADEAWLKIIKHIYPDIQKYDCDRLFLIKETLGEHKIHFGSNEISDWELAYTPVLGNEKAFNKDSIRNFIKDNKTSNGNTSIAQSNPLITYGILTPSSVRDSHIFSSASSVTVAEEKRLSRICGDIEMRAGLG